MNEPILNANTRILEIILKAMLQETYASRIQKVSIDELNEGVWQVLVSFENGHVERFSEYHLETRLLGKAASPILEQIEMYTPKERLMLFHLLDTAGISASKVRSYLEMFESDYKPGTGSWNMWKEAVQDVSGKSWSEIAPFIYGSMFGTVG